MEHGSAAPWPSTLPTALSLMVWNAVLYESMKKQWRKWKIKLHFLKKTVGCLHLIFWPGSQRRVHCHTAKLEPNQRVAIDGVPLLVVFTYKNSVILTTNFEGAKICSFINTSRLKIIKVSSLHKVMANVITSYTSWHPQGMWEVLQKCS
jgi:hypothetical protein